MRVISTSGPRTVQMQAHDNCRRIQRTTHSQSFWASLTFLGRRLKALALLTERGLNSPVRSNIASATEFRGLLDLTVKDIIFMIVE